MQNPFNRNLKRFGIGLFKPGGGGTPKTEFKSGGLDFVNNLWLDISGKSNDAILKNASARTSIAGDLDYVITGLLTTDTVEVETGSDTPTIPINGTLRISESQVIYGVTIKRASVIWAIIPFCEPKININIPIISYDVSGNDHHATCTGLLEANITTQNNYFYLIQYGYSQWGATVINETFPSWTGAFPNEVPDGWSLSNNDADNYVTEAAGGGCRLVCDGNATFQVSKLSVFENEEEYKSWINVIDNIGSENQRLRFSFLAKDSSLLGVALAKSQEFTYIFEHDVGGTQAFRKTLTMGNDAGGSTRLGDYTVLSIVSKKKEIIPALISGVSDTLGNEITDTQDGFKWLEFACDIQMPENASLINSDLVNQWGSLISSGLCVNGTTYIIEKTESDNFGVGKVVHDTFISDGTELCNNDNWTRESIGIEFWFNSGTAQIKSFSDINTILPYKQYYSKPSSYNKYFNKANQEFGFDGYIKDLIIVESGSNFTYSQHLSFVNTLIIPDYYENLISFVWDHPNDATLAELDPYFDAAYMPQVQAVNLNGELLDSQYPILMNKGDEVCIHTPKDTEGYLSTRLGFAETLEFYTSEQLSTYYDDCKQWASSKGITSLMKIYPGGQQDEMTRLVAPENWRMSFKVTLDSWVEGITYIPIKNYNNQPRIQIDSADYNTWVSFVDELITINGGLLVFYGHPKDWTDTKYNDDGIEDVGGDTILEKTVRLIDYIKTKTISDSIRVTTLTQALDIFENKR